MKLVTIGFRSGVEKEYICETITPCEDGILMLDGVNIGRVEVNPDYVEYMQVQNYVDVLNKFRKQGGYK